MHIAFINTRSDAIGGSQVHVRDLASALLAKNHRVTVLVGGTGPVTQDLQQRGIPFHSLNYLQQAIRPASDAPALWELRSVLRRLAPDLVSTHTAKAGLLGRLAAAYSGIPSIFTPHGWCISADRFPDRAHRMAFCAAERLGGKLASRIVNVCEYEYALAIRSRIVDVTKMSVIHNGVPDVQHRLRAHPGGSPPHIIMVARMEKEKNHALLIQALRTLVHTEWRLTFVGDGPLEPELRRMVGSAGLENRVRFYGASLDVRPILASGQLFVLSTRTEAFPRSILEAMRAGLPVISTDVGGVKEAIQHRQTGLLVDRDDLQNLSDAIASLLGDPQERTRLGQSARRTYEEKFTFEITFSKTLQLYEEVLRAHEPKLSLSPAPV